LENRSVADVFQDRIFGPLEMTDTALDDSAVATLTTGYHRQRSEDELELLRRGGREVTDGDPIDGHNVRGEHLYTWGNGAQGGARSTIPDMARYASALLRGGKGLVRPETLALMTDDHWRPDKRLPGRGLGFGLGKLGARDSFGHTGEYIGGWHSVMTIYPKEDAAVLIHINATFPAFESTAKTILAAVFDEPPQPLPEAPIDPQVLATAPGVYEATEPGPLTNFRVIVNVGRIQVAAQNGGLVMYSRRGVWKRGVPLLPVDPSQPDLFAIAMGDPQPQLMTLLRDGEGAVTGLRFPQFVDMYPTERVQPWA
jgi:CubicO group peptidase (beta-lactamase class C family)